MRDPERCSGLGPPQCWRPAREVPQAAAVLAGVPRFAA